MEGKKKIIQKVEKSVKKKKKLHNLLISLKEIQDDMTSIRRKNWVLWEKDDKKIGKNFWNSKNE